MASSAQAFPVEQFLECIHDNRSTSHEFISQVHNLNIEWIYEIIKHCHNLIADIKQLPETKLSALQMIKDMVQTVQIPCINLIQIYILPMIYEIVIQKPQQKIEKRAVSYFQHQTKTTKAQNIEQIGVRFIKLCEEMIYVCALIKPKRIFQNKELNQKSQFKDSYEKMQKYQIIGIPKSIEDIKRFSHDLLQNGRGQFLNNMASFSKESEQYYEYFVTKILDSLEQASNPLFNNGNVSNASPSADLDMRKLLKHGDTCINTPLIDQLLIKIKISDNFAAKKNCISLFTDFIKWGDAEALWKVCTDDSFFEVGKRILEVKGQNGLAQGENIYPQIKGQREGKRKFYTQYLKSLEVVCKCLESCNMEVPNMEKIIDLYKYAKKQKKFEFPQNLMTKKIDSDFQQNIKVNTERNSNILIRLSQLSQSGNFNSKISEGSKLKNINKDMEECLQQFLKLTENKQIVDDRMGKLTKFKQNFSRQLENIEQQHHNLKEEEIEQIVDNGIELSKNIQKLQKLHKKYKNGEISYDIFRQEHKQLLKDYDIEDEKSQSHIQKPNKAQALNKIQLPAPTINKQQSFNHSIPQAPPTANSPPKIQRPPTFASSSVEAPFILTPIEANAKTSPNFILTQSNGLAKQKQLRRPSENAAIPKDMTNYSQIKKAKITSAHEYQLVNQNPQVDKNMASQNWSSILKLEGGEVGSKISSVSNQQNQHKKSYSKISQGSTIKQRVNNYKKQKERNSNIEFKQSSSISDHTPHDQQHIVINSQQGAQQWHDTKPVVVEYVNYRSPQSFTILKPNNTQQNFGSQNNNLQPSYNSFGVTMPANGRNSLGKANIANSGQKQKSPSQEYAQNRTSRENKSIEMSKASQYEGKNLQQQLYGSNRMPVQQVASPSRGYMTQDGQIHQLVRDSYKLEQPNIYTNQNAQFKQQRLYYTGGENQGFRQSNRPEPWSNTMPLTTKENKPSSQYQAPSLPQNYVFRNTYISNVENSKLSNPQTVLYEEKPNSLRGSQKQHQNPKSVYYTASNMMTNYDNYDNDYIKQPNSQPLNNSYYGVQEIEKNVKNSLKPQFKQCFQIHKQIIPSAISSRVLKKQSSAKASQTYSPSPQEAHEQYLISKLQRELSQQKQQQTKILQNRILELKTSNSKLRSQVSERANSNRENLSNSKFSERSSSSSGKYVAFSNSKVSHRSDSPLSLKPGSLARSSNSNDDYSLLREGDLINRQNHQRYLMEFNDERLCKNCLRNKSIIAKNELYQIGYIAINPQQTAKLIIYFTPFEPVCNFKISLSKEPNIETQVYSKQYDQLNSNKQIKIEVNAQLRNIPFTLPLMTLEFSRGREKKNISFYLPLSFNKFLKFNQVDKTRVQSELAGSISNLKRTEEFVINRNVFKRKQLAQLFPYISSISHSSKIQKYAVGCQFKSSAFILLVALLGKDKMQLQTISRDQNIFAQYLLASLQNIIQSA